MSEIIRIFEMSLWQLDQDYDIYGVQEIDTNGNRTEMTTTVDSIMQIFEKFSMRTCKISPPYL